MDHIEIQVKETEELSKTLVGLSEEEAIEKINKFGRTYVISDTEKLYGQNIFEPNRIILTINNNIVKTAHQG